MAETSHSQGTLDADEPKTPLWVTALGGALFGVAAIVFLATREDAPADQADPDAPEAAAVAPAADPHPDH